MARISLTTATEADLPSLETVVPRSFHKRNEYFRNTFPDTPLVRTWWGDIFRDEMQDPKSHVFVAIDPDAPNSSPEARQVVGVMILRRFDAGEAVHAGSFARHEPTADHDQARYQAMLEGGDEPVPDYMAGRPHYNIQLLGVDDRYQRAGLGTNLLRRACEISAADRVDIWVQANLGAKPFYERVGFVCKHQVTLPGSDGYGQAILLYSIDEGR